MDANDLPIWEATAQQKEQSHLQLFWRFVEQNYTQSFDSYWALHEWSIQHLGEFWQAIACYFEIDFNQKPQQWIDPQIPFYKTQWLVGAELSYTQQILKNYKNGQTAIIFQNEAGEKWNITWNSLIERAHRIQKQLIEVGIGKGDRVVAYVLNHPDTVAAFLATNAIGAVWSSCSPDFGINAVIDRFEQLSPKALIAHQSYTYNGKSYDQNTKIDQLEERLSSLKSSIRLSNDFSEWDLTTTAHYDLDPINVAFDHPIWVLFSSGTTGKPKAITHRTGGMLLEQLKALAIHQNLQVGEKLFWNTTTGWMMWNYALGALLCGGVLCLYDGAATYPDIKTQWSFAAENEIEHFGHGAPYYIHCMKMGVDNIYYPALKTIGSTGAPLTEEAFEWLQQQFPKAQLISLSGGTDVCTAFIGGNILHPVYAGWLQSPMLGAAIEARDENGNPVFETTAELVISKPMPCMPLYFWGDKDFEKYHDSYFKDNLEVWSHGDYIQIHPTKGIQIHGRSDATLNRGGIRIGTAEIYRALDELSFVKDHLVVDVPEGSTWKGLLLFIVGHRPLAASQKKDINRHLIESCSPRHVPDKIIEVAEIPYTISGKKMEIPVKKLFMGIPLKRAANIGAMKNPTAMEKFKAIYLEQSH